MTNEEQVARLLEKRKAEPDQVEEEIPSIVGEYDLEEIEQVKMENIALKKEQLRLTEMQLMGVQEQLMKRIRERLGVSDEYGISFNMSMTKVKVEKRRALDEQREQEQPAASDETRT